VIPYTSLDKWLKRYEEEGPKGLETRTRVRKKQRPHPKRMPDSARDLIAEVQAEHPDFGMNRLADHLARFHNLKVSPSGARKILLERGVEMLPGPRKKPRPKSKPPRRFERARPGQMWQSDITSFVLRRHHRRVYLTVFLDDHSRYVVAWRLASRQTAPLVIDTVLDGVARFGKPEEILTDQGRQYYAWRGKSAFQKLLAKEGIKHIVSRPHHPQTLGKCERLWKTVGDEFWDRAVPADLDDARERMGHWFSHYNHFRTHQGIDGLVPADRFFGAESTVRESLEAAQAENELRLALDEAPRRSVYLVGQIGSQRISLHGERGKLLVDTPDGGQRELSMNDLGLEQQETCDEADRAYDSERNGRQSAGNPLESGETQDATQAHGPQALGVQEDPEACLAGAGAVGERASGGAGTCPQDMHGGPGILAGQEVQGERGAGPGGEPSTGLAIEPEGPVGNAGGAPGSTTHEGEPGGLRGPGNGEPGGAQAAYCGAGDDAESHGGYGADLENRPMAKSGSGGPSEGPEGREVTCTKEAREKAQAGQGKGRSHGAYGCESEPSSGAASTAGWNWLRRLRR